MFYIEADGEAGPTAAPQELLVQPRPLGDQCEEPGEQQEAQVEATPEDIA